MALSLPKKPKQSFLDKVRDVVDANSSMDQYKRAQAGQPLDYATQQRAMGNARPAQNLGQAVLGNTARVANTALNLSYNTIPKAGAGIALMGANRLGLMSNRDYNNAVNNAFTDKNIYGKYGSTGGLFNAGTVIDSPEQAMNLSTKDVAKKSLGYGAGVYGELGPIKAPGGVVGRTLMGATEAAIGDAGSQLASNGKVNWRQTAQSAAFGAALPNVIPAGKKVASSITDLADLPWTSRKLKSQAILGQLDESAQASARQKASITALDSTVSRNQAEAKFRGDYNQPTPLGLPAPKQNFTMPNVDANRVAIGTEKLASDYAREARRIENAFKGSPRRMNAELDALDAKYQAKHANLIDGVGEFAPQVGKTPTQKPVVTSKKPTTTQVSSIAQGRAVEAPVKPTVKEAFVPGEAKPVVNLNQADALPTRMKGGTGPTYQRDMNVRRYNLPEEDIATLSELSGKDVTRMKNTDIEEAAKFLGVDTTKLSDKEQLAILGGRLNQSREVTSKVAAIGELKASGAAEDAIKKAVADARKSIEIDQSQKTFAGRQLQMERIIKSKLTPEDKFIRMLVTSGADPNKIDDAIMGLDLSTPEAAIRAWREAVPATAEDWLTKYRYTNMLSSPLTHVVNFFGNLQSVSGVRPLTMAVTGALDAMKSTVSGKPRVHYIGEAPRYIKGTLTSIGSALDAAFKSMDRFSDYKQNPDIIGDMNTPLSVDGLSGQADAALSFIPKLLNAGDVLFKKISEGGETAALGYRASKGAFTGDIAEQATKNADYTLFRSKLGGKEQGQVLQAIDFLPQKINDARRSNNAVVRFASNMAFPFVQTPTNIFKQGIEYSPLGFTTMVGSADKTAQAAKALMGTTAVALAAGTFAANDAITGAEPADAKQRDAFRAEGKQPWSIKIGGKWVNYSKLHPSIAFNLATVAAVKDAMDKGTIDQSGADKVMSLVGGVLGFYRDQSYFKGIGDFTNMIQGIDTSSIGDTISSTVGSTASQYIPLQSFNNWVGRIINDTQTKVDYSADMIHQTIQRLFKDYPAGGEMTGAPERVNPYTNEPIQSENRGINAISPVKITNDKGFGNTTGLNVDERMMQQQQPDREAFRQEIMTQKGIDKLDKKAKDTLKEADSKVSQAPSGKFFAKLDNEVQTFDTREEADIAIAKDGFKKSDKNFEIVGETVFRKSATGEVTVTPKTKYDYQVGTAELAKYKKADDLAGWTKTADKQLQNIDKQLQDPNIDELDRIELENKAQTIIDDYQKYLGYGGFTKGSGGGSGGSGGGINATSYLSGAPQANASVRPTVSSRSGSGAKYQVARRTSSAKPKVSVKRSKV